MRITSVPFLSNTPPKPPVTPAFSSVSITQVIEPPLERRSTLTNLSLKKVLQATKTFLKPAVLIGSSVFSLGHALSHFVPAASILSHEIHQTTTPISDVSTATVPTNNEHHEEDENPLIAGLYIAASLLLAYSGKKDVQNQIRNHQWQSKKVQTALNAALTKHKSPFRLELLDPNSPDAPLSNVPNVVKQIQAILNNPEKLNPPEGFSKRLWPLYQPISNSLPPETFKQLQMLFNRMGLVIVPIKKTRRSKKPQA